MCKISGVKDNSIAVGAVRSQQWMFGLWLSLTALSGPHMGTQAAVFSTRAESRPASSLQWRVEQVAQAALQ